jgi:hypothetical protein
MIWIVRLILAGLFVFVIITVAAFVYLKWWQAILASAATFVLMIWGTSFLIRTVVGGFLGAAKQMFEVKSKVLRNAKVEVHAVDLTDAPADWSDHEFDEDNDPDDPPPDLNWYRIDATIIPDPASAGGMTHWDLSDLTLVEASAFVPSGITEMTADEGDGFIPSETVLVIDGAEVEPDGPKLLGTQRLRMVVGLPESWREAKFRYYFESFGRIRLPQA